MALMSRCSLQFPLRSMVVHVREPPIELRPKFVQKGSEVWRVRRPVQKKLLDVLAFHVRCELTYGSMAGRSILLENTTCELPVKSAATFLGHLSMSVRAFCLKGFLVVFAHATAPESNPTPITRSLLVCGMTCGHSWPPTGGTLLRYVLSPTLVYHSILLFV